MLVSVVRGFSYWCNDGGVVTSGRESWFADRVRVTGVVGVRVSGWTGYCVPGGSF